MNNLKIENAELSAKISNNNKIQIEIKKIIPWLENRRFSLL